MNPSPITEKMSAWAEKKAAAHIKGPRYDKATDTKNSVLIGYLGEAAFWMDNQGARHYDRPEFDFIVNGCTHEVKAAASAVPPLPWYDVKIPQVDIGRTDPHATLTFYQIDLEGLVYWRLGSINYQEFIMLSKVKEKGELFERKDGKLVKKPFAYVCDCRALVIDELF